MLFQSHKRRSILPDLDVSVLNDVQALVRDAQGLLKVTADQTGEKVQQARARIEESLQNAQEHLIDMQSAALKRAKLVAKATDKYVNENPWQAVGVGVVAGVLVGLLLRGTED